MNTDEFISSQTPERQPIMNALHKAILAGDPSVTALVEPMMGMQMILYKQCNVMKYGLAGAKKHMSLHCLPMYMDPAIHAKYSALLHGAKFQKGCINFTDAEEFPVSVAEVLISDCAGVNIAGVLENRKKKK